MKTAKALVATTVTALTAFLILLVEFLAPELPKELIASGGVLFSAFAGIAVYYIPNKE